MTEEAKSHLISVPQVDHYRITLKLYAAAHVSPRRSE